MAGAAGNQYKSIIFDLDGTLTDPKIGITTCVRHALLLAGIQEGDMGKLLPYIGPPLARSFREFHGLTPVQVEKAILDYRERFSTLGMYENEVYTGIPEMLRVLKEQGFFLALATSKLEIYAIDILKHFALDSFFDFIAGSLRDGSRSEKGDVIRHVIQSTGFQLEETLMVGDTKYDIEGAKENNIASLAVAYGYGTWQDTLDAGPTYTCGTVSELKNLLIGFAERSAK